jgi:alkylation response protein AidB-like acyl-CoA dehydrogenase
VSENLFTDYPERVEQLVKYSDLDKIAMPLEETFGEPGFYKSTEEAMEFYVGALTEIGRFCAKEVKPTAAAIDREGAKLKDGKVTLPEALESHLKKCVELGVFSAPIHRAYGGLNFPWSVQIMAIEMFGHACPNTALTIANFSMAGFIERVGTEEQKQKYLPKMLTVEWKSSMALTEAGAGSDLGQLRTTAVKNGDHYLVNGSKRFISSGNSEISFVLARTDPQSTGLEGLSVLIVHRDLEGSDKPNFVVPKIEDKICLHASPTCEMIFENSIGDLLGQEGQGFKVMLELMNMARLCMSALAVGIAASALDEAKQYARTRVTMGKPIMQHPMVADMIYEMEIEIRAMRAMVFEASSAYDWMLIYEKKGDQKNFKRWKKRYRRLTPLAKYYCCEKAITIAKNAVQIFGGYGVSREYPVERLLRETLIYPIYEGTSQIQSLMVLKDTLKDVSQQAGGFLGSLAGAWAESKLATDPVKSKLLQARNELNQGIKTILLSIIKEKFKSDVDSLKEKKIQEFLKEFSLQLFSAKMDLTMPFLWAERFTRITSDYYALKSMADHYSPGDRERQKWILEFAEIAIPRMRLENHYIVHRLPSTLDYLKKEAAHQNG